MLKQVYTKFVDGAWVVQADGGKIRTCPWDVNWTDDRPRIYIEESESTKDVRFIRGSAEAVSNA